MQPLIENKNLIQSLTTVKQELSKNLTPTQDKFNDVLKESLESSSDSFFTLNDIPSINKINENDIPEWVDPSYGYDPNNPRKPNLRELTEAIAGKSIEEMQADGKSNLDIRSNIANELLYGVVGSKKDTRDWNTIMRAENILEAAREETNKMHNPVVDITSEFDSQNQLIKQYAVIKDSDGEQLRTLSGSIEAIENILLNFSVREEGIPRDLEDRITVQNFDEKILQVLINLSEKRALQNLSPNTKATLEQLSSKSGQSPIDATNENLLETDKI